ncbi:anthranilate synthase component I family protein [Cohnella sp. AR92]|nr:anthranilate synthase component I family protein [Cohnella sp. AR92]
MERRTSVEYRVTLLEHWRSWGEHNRSVPRNQAYTCLPMIKRYPLERGEDRILLWRRAWEAADEHAIVLESGKGGRYTYLAIRPDSIVRGRGEAGVAFYPKREAARTENLNGKPLSVLRHWIGDHRAPKAEGAPPFAGGAAGFLGYDVARSLERLPELASDDLRLPDYAFLLLNEVWILDHERSELFCAIHLPIPETAWSYPPELDKLYEEASSLVDKMKAEWDAFHAIAKEEGAQDERASMRKMLAEDDLQMDIEAYAGIRTAMTKEQFKEAVRAVQRYISQGDVFQVNLSLRQSRPVRTKPAELYEWLRLVNPSPYMGYLHFPDFQLVSASPELLVKLDGNKMSARPIAGTRRRGRSEDEDRGLAEELLASEKERAEHIMLVDLERNDLGRVAEYGTVHVPELLTIERYSHVMHLVSQVEGTLAPGKDAFDLIGATFPGGTITGAPKIRTMEIIEELEPVRRGPYTGSLGWIDYAGNMEFNIIIRTIAVQDGVCHIQAGAGIVIDSDPEREFHECLNKAKALWKAVQYGEKRQEEAGSAEPG